MVEPRPLVAARSAPDPKGRSCVFCGGRPVTNEHVWPRWVGELVQKHTGVSFFKTAIGDRRWDAPKIDIQVRRVCDPCNTGWMSEIETRTKPILAPMIVGDPDTALLSPADQVGIASWAVKLALMLDFAHESDPIIPSSEYEHFYRLRHPRGGTVVWLGAYLGSQWGAWARRESLHLRRRAFKAHFPPPETPNLYILTLAVYRVVFQVVHYFERQSVEIAEAWPGTDALIRLWPNTGDPRVWPANGLAFNDTELVQLATREDFF